MSRGPNNRTRPLGEARAYMVERLREQQPDIEAAILTRVHAVSGAVGIGDVEYQAGLNLAVEAIMNYSLTCIERGEEWSEPIPSAAIAQTRRAARTGVGLDMIVLRYIAGYRLLGKFIMDEADRSGLSNHGSALRELRSIQEAVLEHLTIAIGNEYKRESERLAGSAETRRREVVQKLLAGEPVDTLDLNYEVDDAWHLGVIAAGARAEKITRGLADRLDRKILLVPCSEGWVVWAWLGGRRELAITDLKRALPLDGKTGVSVAIGEPRKGVYGWRLTHVEARAALQVALHTPRPLTRCADVPLEAAVLQHPEMTRLLVGNYLSPLDNLRMGGPVARETLRAYFKCERNVSSTAHLLGVARHTVENRLREIEKILGRALNTCLAELEIVLRLETYGVPSHESPV